MHTLNTTPSFIRTIIRKTASPGRLTIVSLLWICSSLCALESYAQTLVAGWDFQTTASGGTATAAAPATPRVYQANAGSGTFYLDGTNGSSSWFVPATGSTNTELNAFTGTSVNATNGLSAVTTSPAALAVLGGLSNAANGKTAVFTFSMTNRVNLNISYASQRTTSGFTTQVWEYSTDGIAWSPIQTVSTIATSFAQINLPVVTGLNGVGNARVRVTFSGATTALGNNRLDNIQFTASAGISLATGTVSPLVYCVNTTTGASLNVPYTVNAGTPGATNVFSVQLSNAAGSFASPVTIGSFTGTNTSGTISCTIPAGTPAGSGYRVRVIASNPASTGADNGQNISIGNVSASASNNGPVCAGLSLSLNASGGIGYSWTGPNGFTSTTQNPSIALTSVADSGDYTVIVTDANGCTGVATTLAVVQNCSCVPPVLSASASAPSCFGGTNGSIDLSVSGGVSPYTFAWSNGASVEDPSGLSAGTYSVIVSDAVACSDTLDVVVGSPTAISTNVTVTAPGCQGFSNGSLNLTVSGGTPGYTFLWDIGATTEDITGLSAGFYSVTVTDAAGCITNAFGTVTDPGNFTVSAISTNVTCAGNSNGTVNLTASNDSINNSNPGLLISEFLANPVGADSSKEWVELVATRFIDFSITPYTVVVANNGAATTKGWVQGGVASATTNGTYAFEINSGVVATGDVVYVGGSNMAVNGTKISVRDVTTQPGAGGIGGVTVGGVIGNGTTNADGIAVFSQSAATLDSTTAPVDAIFYGSGYGTAIVAGGTAGFKLPVNDRYSGGFFQGSSFLGPDAAANGIFVRATGAYNSLTGQYTARAWATSPTYTDDTTAVAIISGNTYQWSNGATTEDISGLSGGTYTVTVTSAAGCTAGASVTITEPTAVQVSGIVFNVTCFGASDGSIDLTATGGSAPYTYLWNDGDVSEDRSQLVTGIYTCTVTDAAGCQHVQTFNLSQPNDFSYTTVVTNPSCFGAADGAIDLSLLGGTAPYSFSWSTGDTTEDISNQLANFFFFNVTDANGCVTGGLEFINDPAQIIVSGFSPLTAGAGVQVTINGSGFTGATDVKFGTVSAGSFVVVSDVQITAVVPSGAETGLVSIFTSSTCSAASIDTFFYDPTACTPPSLSATATAASCNGASDGSIDLTVTGGVAPYSYSWNNGSNSEDIAGVLAGTYTVIVSDASSCPDTLTVSVGEPSAISITASLTGIVCSTGSDGAVDISVSGGTAPYTFIWSNGPTTEDITGLTAGTYSVTILDNNSCAGSAAFTLTDPAFIAISITATDPTCTGGANGALAAMVTGGVPPYLYAWSSGATTATATGLTAGGYVLTITDSLGCVATTSTVIIDPAPFTLSVTGTTDATCFGTSTGSVDIVASNEPSTPVVNPGLLISEFMADPSGTDNPFEWVELIATKPINFTQTPYTVVVSNNGTATSKGWRAGGTLTYAFQISSGVVNTGDVFYVGGSSMAPTGLKLRTINTVTTAGDGFGSANASLGNGGTNADGVAVFNLSAALIDSSTVPVDAIFFGTGLGTAVLNAGANGYTLPVNDRYNGGNLNTGAFFAGNAVSGTPHKATGSFNTVTGVYNTRVWTTNTPFTDGTSAISVISGNTYVWSNGASTQDLSGVPAGTYTVTATSPVGCTATATVTIGQPADLTVASFTPATGTEGTTVVITGTGFNGVDAVLFNGLAATFTVDNDNQISAVVPVGASSGTIECINTACDTAISSVPFTVTANNATLNLTAIIQGYYDGISGNAAVLQNAGVGTNATECDTIVIELRDALSPTTVVSSQAAVLGTNGQVTVTYPGSVTGNSYYIALLHRNAVQTWSAAPVTMAAITSYDFTTAATQAFGSNLTEVAPGVWALYSGDLAPQDEVVDFFDQVVLDNDVAIFATGYTVSDLTGDGLVDFFDQVILDNNITNFVSSVHP